MQSLAPKRWYRLIPIAFITYSLSSLLLSAISILFGVRMPGTAVAKVEISTH